MDADVLEKELAQFLTPDTKEELKTVAVENVIGLTGTKEGRQFLGESDKLIKCILSLVSDKRKDIQESAYKMLINLAVEEDTSWKILNAEKYEKEVCEWLKKVLDPTCKQADLISKLVSNLTRSEKCAMYVGKMVLNDLNIGVERMIMALCNLMYNEQADLHYLAPILSNLSQFKDIRTFIIDKEKCIIQRLLPFTTFMQSSIRRAGVVGTLKNCCFDTEHHDWLLSDAVDLLPCLLLPLAGPEELDDDDNDKLPDSLQYLPDDKTREPEPHIRKMICEALLQLGATKKGRQYLKDKNTYVIMREYYAWERKVEPLNEIAAMNVIDILISDTPADSFGEDLKNVDIPEEMKEKFVEDDEKELKQALEEKAKVSQDETS